MRNSRSIRNRVRRKKTPLIDLDITSLLDILTIMLVFLLKSYNASGVVVNVPKGIDLPYSQSKEMNTTGVVIQVSSDKIYVDDKVVLDYKDPPPAVYDDEDRRIVPLFNELVQKKETIKTVQKSSSNAAPFSGKINLIVDKTIKYSYIKKLLYTCAEAGFQQYKFIVMGREQ